MAEEKAKRPTMADARNWAGDSLADYPDGFVAVWHPEAGTAFIPDAPGVVERHEAMGWERVIDEPEPEAEATPEEAQAQRTAPKSTGSSDAGK